MRIYETGFLIAPKLNEEEVKKIVDETKKIVNNKGGKIIELEEWGKRKLAYPINHFDEAYYFFLIHESPAPLPRELERKFRQNEAIIRFLTVKINEKILEERKKTKGTHEIGEEEISTSQLNEKMEDEQ